MKHGAKPEKSGDAKPPILTIWKDSGAAMNTSKEAIMKSIKLKSSVFSVVAVLWAMPSLAQSFGTDPVSVTSSPAMPQHISSVVYKSAATENQLSGTLPVTQVPGLGDEASKSSKVKFFRPDRLGMTNSRNNMLIKNDRTSFSLNAPMPAVNGVLSFVGTVYQTPLDGSATKWIQVLSLAATRRINAEYAYSAPINKYSRLDSVIAYRLHPATGSGKSSDVAASLQYSIKF